ncbi:BAR-domain-containing protein [Fomitiporia mediterranea MF3/22]|uniref:BAR-domain-containing protein n=1 Tax=Fomitiporia mediterranea (strain MF3/22) TaxID=694068 RepID=UPI0004408B31|nr:BAR-domain-containing protein [Fomitiporia mediterranea MF3/22]EJD05243.1 BAR-domain-containing protein [Fomitiporia mediterranea MF3/22]
MASKQLGKLRQWAGEVISSREKTQPSSEFAALEQDMETRKKGIDNLYTASKDYVEHISLKNKSEALPEEEVMMQTEALGMVMKKHGEELGDASALGRSLISFGRARCQIAAIQNIYSVTLTDTFLAYLLRSGAELDEYAAQRKKLESRRLAYDAAIAKAEKTYKKEKEKDKKEAEEELAKAKARYEEMGEDVRARMEEIREGEVEHQRELESFLRVETQFVEQYLGVLKEVKSEWPEPDTYADLRRPTSAFSTPHEFSRTSTRSTDSKSSDAKQAPHASSRFGSHRSSRSVLSVSSKKSASTRSTTNQHESSSESEAETPHSRSSSRLSRKRSTRSSNAHSRNPSVTTIGAIVTDKTTDDAVSTKSNGKAKKASGSGGVTGWMGDAMSSVMSRNKSRNTDVENFAALGDEDEVEGVEKNGAQRKQRRLSNRSTRSDKSNGGKSRSQSKDRAVENGGSSKRVRRVMKALYDFSGSSDELSFKAGDEIVVVNEVLEDWWLGEIGGRKGLFPANYTIFIKTVEYSGTKFKNTSNSSILALGRGSGKFSSEDEEIRRTLVEPSESELSMTEDEQEHEHEHDGDSINGWHPFDDRNRSSSGSAAVPSGMVMPLGERDRNVADAAIPPYDGRSGPLVDDAEFDRRLSTSLAKLDVQQQQPPLNATSHSPSPSPVKRMPPPPPPRRQTTSNGVGNLPPPLPVRNLVAPVLPSRTHSSNAALQSLATPQLSLMDRKAHSDTSSPFESQSELSFDAVATTTTAKFDACATCGCGEFVEDPFRGHGLCANCTHAHV